MSEGCAAKPHLDIIKELAGDMRAGNLTPPLDSCSTQESNPHVVGVGCEPVSKSKIMGKQALPPIFCVVEWMKER